MAYITQQDMIEAFGREEVIALSNLDDPDAEEINTIILQRAIDDASASVDGYLQARYTVPIIPTPPFLKRITGDFTRGLLDEHNPREEVIRRWNLAIAFLKDIAKGVASLPVPESGLGVEVETSIPDYVTNPPVFTFDSLRDW